MAALLAALLATPVAAQAPRPSTAPPYEAELLRLSAVMGSLAYLRGLCGGAEAGSWQDRMAALIDAEGRSPERRERLTGAFNRGYRAYAATHRSCTPVSREAAGRLAEEGEKLAQALASRFGG